jgi:hypothetical protein
MKLRETGELTQLLQREKRPRWHYVAAAAAIAALAIGTFLLIDRTPASHPVLAASIDALHATGGVPPTLTGQYAILRTRGSAVDAEIELPPAGQALPQRPADCLPVRRHEQRVDAPGRSSLSGTRDVRWREAYGARS